MILLARSKRIAMSGDTQVPTKTVEVILKMVLQEYVSGTDQSTKKAPTVGMMPG
jgi:hypothetical protein